MIWACIRIVKHRLAFINHLAMKVCVYAELSRAVRQRYHRKDKTLRSCAAVAKAEHYKSVHFDLRSTFLCSDGSCLLIVFWLEGIRDACRLQDSSRYSILVGMHTQQKWNSATRRFQLPRTCRNLHALQTTAHQGMMADSDFVLVQKSVFDHLRQHYTHCHGFDGQLLDSPDGRVILVPSGCPGATSSKRKIPPGSGSQGLNGSRKRLRPANAALS